jgi:hypothetical protein
MKSVVLVVVTLIATVQLLAECKTEKMVRIVVRDISGEITPDSFKRKPRAIFRVGTKMGRIEEAPDPARGLHGLLIVNEPDAWLVNQVAKSGKHMLDPGPTFVFRAPVFWAPGMPEWLKDLEFGCELAFMQSRQRGPVVLRELGGAPVREYQATEGSHKLIVLVGRDDKKPRTISLFEEGKLTRALQYDSYEEGLAIDVNLFRPPKWVTIDKVK